MANTLSHADTVADLCRAIRAEIGCSFFGIRSRSVKSTTFDFVCAEFDVDADLPANIAEMAFTTQGVIVADVAAINPRTLAVLAVGD